jgi:hypothetical protein
MPFLKLYLQIGFDETFQRINVKHKPENTAAVLADGADDTVGDQEPFQPSPHTNPLQLLFCSSNDLYRPTLLVLFPVPLAPSRQA